MTIVVNAAVIKIFFASPLGLYSNSDFIPRSANTLGMIPSAKSSIMPSHALTQSASINGI